MPRQQRSLPGQPEERAAGGAAGPPHTDQVIRGAAGQQAPVDGQAPHRAVVPTAAGGGETQGILRASLFDMGGAQGRGSGGRRIRRDARAAQAAAPAATSRCTTAHVFIPWLRHPNLPGAQLHP